MPFISKPSFVAWAFVVALAICRTALGEGDLDYTFKNGGYTYAPLPYTASTYSSCTASDAAIQADGKLLIAGVCDIRTDTVNSVGLIAVMRINRDGTVDTTFGNKPWTVLSANPSVPGYQFVAAGAQPLTGNAGVAVRPNGRIVVAGNVADPARFSATSIGVAQLLSDGST